MKFFAQYHVILDHKVLRPSRDHAQCRPSRITHAGEVHFFAFLPMSGMSGLARAAVFGKVDKMETGVTVCSDEDDVGNRRYPKYL